MHLYIHVPFCARRCSYCDFAIAVRKEVPSRVYVDAVLAEWSRWRGRLADPGAAAPMVETLYFGGGTPSHLDPMELRRLIEQMIGTSPQFGNRETTLETNPDDVTVARALAWRVAGIDRFSLGVQSFDAGVLAWMHRVHSTAQSLEAVKMLRGETEAGISLDLIYALPPELKRDWARDLDQALALEPDHLSLYGLTVEPHTPLFKWVEGKKARVADEDRYAEEFLLAHERLTAAGFEHYEVSNYARPGKRAIHNSAYWQRRPFLGLGPSAHSAIGDRRWWNVREYAAWLEAGAGALGRSGSEEFPATVAGSEVIDDERRRLEDLYLGLRTSDGLKADLLTADHIARWVGQGWAVSAGGMVRLTPEGWLRLDALVAQVA